MIAGSALHRREHMIPEADGGTPRHGSTPGHTGGRYRRRRGCIRTCTGGGGGGGVSGAGAGEGTVEPLLGPPPPVLQGSSVCWLPTPPETSFFCHNSQTITTSH